MLGCCGEQTEVNKTGSKENGEGLLHGSWIAGWLCQAGRQPVVGDGANCRANDRQARVWVLFHWSLLGLWGALYSGYTI